MDYIFNIKAQLLDGGANVKSQYAILKQSIEKDIIKVKAILDTESLSLKSIQEQLNKEKVTINVGDVKFDSSNMESMKSVAEQAAKATDNIANSMQNAREQVEDLVSKIQKGFPSQSYNNALGGLGLDKDYIAKAQKQLEDLGLTIDKVSAKRITNNEGTENESHIVQALVQATDKYGKIITLSQTFKNNEKQVETQVVSITDNIKKQTQEQQKANKELEKQKSLYSDLSSKFEALYTTQSSGKSKIDGISIGSDNRLQVDDIANATKEMQSYKQAYDSGKAALEAFEKAVNDGKPVNQEYIDTIRSSITEMRAYGKVVHDQQSGSVGNFDAKDIKELQNTATIQLDSFEEKVKASGLATESLTGRIAELKTQLANVKVSDDYSKFTDQFRTAKAEFESLQQSAKLATTEITNASKFDQLKNDYEELKQKVKEYDLSLQDIADVNRNAVANITSLKDLLSQDSLNTNELKEAKAYYDSVKSSIEQVIDAKKRSSQTEAFNLDKDRAAQSLTEIEKKIQDLNIDESTLSHTTAELREKFDSITNGVDLSTFNKMLAQTSKEVNSQTQELQTQEIEWQKLTDLANKTYANATNSSKGSGAIENAESIKLLRTQYDNVIEAVNRLKGSTTETFAENKQAAEQAIQALQNYATVLQNSEKEIKSTGDAVKKLQTDTSKGLFAQNAGDTRVVELQQEVNNLMTTYQQLQSQFQSQGATQSVMQGFAQLSSQLQTTSQKATELQQSLKGAKDAAKLDDAKSRLNNQIEMWLQNNTKASESMRQSMRALQNQIQSADKQTLENLNQQFKNLDRQAQQTGQTGKSLYDIFKEKLGKFAGWFNLSQGFMAITNEAKQALVTLKEVDSILTEISKTSERSEESLQRLGESAFDAASKYGVSVQSYLTGVQEMARAGYEVYGEEQSENMAKLALLTQAAGDVTDSVARDYLIATDAAYQLGGSIEKLHSILDGQNKVKIKCPLVWKHMSA